MKKFIDSILKNKKSLNQRFDEKEMELINAESPKNFDDLRNTTNNPLEKNSLYFADLFYNEKYPTIEFSFRKKDCDISYFIAKEDQYFGSWVIRGDDFMKVSEIFSRISPPIDHNLILRDTNRVANEMNKLNFKYEPLKGQVIPVPFKNNDGKNLYKAKHINN